MVTYVTCTRQVRQHSGLSTWHTGLRGQACGTCAKWERAHRSLIRRPMMRRRADREVEEPTRPPPSDIRTDADRQAYSSAPTQASSDPHHDTTSGSTAKRKLRRQTQLPAGAGARPMQTHVRTASARNQAPPQRSQPLQRSAARRRSAAVAPMYQLAMISREPCNAN